MDLKKILGNIGVKALSSVFPPVGAMAAGVLKDVLGLDKKASEEEVIEAVSNATPEQVIALQEAEYSFKIKLKEMNIDILELDKQDRMDARKFAKDTGSKSIGNLSIFNALFVLIITIGTFVLAYAGKITDMNALEASVLTLLIREAFGRYEQVCNFFFGSSHGSKQKTDLMGGK